MCCVVSSSLVRQLRNWWPGRRRHVFLRVLRFSLPRMIGVDVFHIKHNGFRVPRIFFTKNVCCVVSSSSLVRQLRNWWPGRRRHVFLRLLRFFPKQLVAERVPHFISASRWFDSSGTGGPLVVVAARRRRRRA